MSQAAAYERFVALHAQGCFIMPNGWDGASAVLFKNAGFQAIGTSSAAIAFGMGRHDAVDNLDGRRAGFGDRRSASVSVATRMARHFSPHH